MKYFAFLFLLAAACSQQEKPDQAGNGTETVVNDTIPEMREDVASSAVASYSEKVEDPLNDWKFAVEVYETPATFRFLIKIRYMEVEGEDTLKVPNFGIMPKVQLKKGAEDRSCIVGFLDKNGIFKEQKLVAVKNNQLKISTLRHYARTRYKVSK